MLRLHRFGLRDHLAGTFLGWVIEAPADPHILRFFSYRQDFWRNYRSDPHGPVHRRAGETSLRPSGTSRAAGKLDYGRKHPAIDGGAICQVIEPGSSDWPRRGCRERAPSSSSLYADFDRRILLGRLGLRDRLIFRSPLARIAAEVWRPQRYATAP